MGLCDDERSSYLFFSMKRLNKILRDWNDDSRESYPQFTELRDLVNASFPALFAKQSNGLHWFMGSSTSNVLRNFMEPDPWAMAIGSHLHNATAGKNPWDTSDDPPWKVDDTLSIDNLLASTDFVSESYVFRIYREIETAIYALRRYDDKFLKNHSRLDELISRICGICFGIFADNECFAKAYLVNRIAHLIYTEEYPYKKDDLTELLTYGNFFYLNVKHYRSLKELSDIHIELANANELKTLTLEQRFLATVKCTLKKDDLDSFLEKTSKVASLKPFLEEAKKIVSTMNFVSTKTETPYEITPETEVYGRYELTREVYDAKRKEREEEPPKQIELDKLGKLVKPAKKKKSTKKKRAKQ